MPDSTAPQVAVIGAGLMGAGIAQALICADIPVTVFDADPQALQRGVARIQLGVARSVKSGRVPSEEAALARLSLEVSLEAATGQADVVIEAVPESLELKQEVFAALSAAVKDGTVLATNTSELSVTAIAGATSCPEQVIGMHWFNPAPVMKLVEVIRGVDTCQKAVDAVVALARRAGKHTVVCEKDTQGFITTRALVAYWMETIRILEEGVASAKDIDTAMKLSSNYPMGPFELADYVGLDTLLSSADGLVEAFGDRFRPPQALVKLVAAGHLGRKTGRGFFDYPVDASS